MSLSKIPLTRREALRWLLAAAGGFAFQPRPRAASVKPSMRLILCGGDEVFILAGDAKAKAGTRKMWSWRAADCPDIPAALKSAFQTTTDCKPVAGGREILISSSSGAVALVDRKTRRARFHAAVPNAHSIEMLPAGRIAAAASVAASPAGNRVAIFDGATMREIASDRLISAHGLAWDEKRGMLWALGYDELRAYRLAEDAQGAIELKTEFQAKLPDPQGHELTPIPASPRLFLSTGRHCWTFDRDTHRFTRHDALGDLADVKGCHIHPVTGRILYIQAEGTDWWAENVHFLNPKGNWHLAGQKLYKARWL